MNRNIKHILREKITLINLTKQEITIKILKSISQNNNIINKIKLYCNFNITKLRSKNSFLTRKHKICLYTGKRSSILKGFSFSRYKVKGLILQNKYTNIKKHNW